MSGQASPLFELDLAGIEREAWSLLEKAVHNRKSPLRLPSLATVSPEGLPAARTVVLRAVDVAQGLLEVHTDARSPKVAALRAQPLAELCFYTPRHQLQLRARGPVALHHGDEVAAQAWRQTSEFARPAYQGELAPGTPIDSPELAPAEATRDEQNFLVLRLRVERLDWLLLGRAGHRRARLTRAGAGWSATWLAP